MTITAQGISPGMKYIWMEVIPKSIRWRNAGQVRLSRTSCNQGNPMNAVQLWKVDIEVVGEMEWDSGNHQSNSGGDVVKWGILVCSEGS